MFITNAIETCAGGGLLLIGLAKLEQSLSMGRWRMCTETLCSLHIPLKSMDFFPPGKLQIYGEEFSAGDYSWFNIREFLDDLKIFQEHVIA